MVCRSSQQYLGLPTPTSPHAFAYPQIDHDEDGVLASPEEQSHLQLEARTVQQQSPQRSTFFAQSWFARTCKASELLVSLSWKSIYAFNRSSLCPRRLINHSASALTQLPVLHLSKLTVHAKASFCIQNGKVSCFLGEIETSEETQSRQGKNICQLP